MTDEIQEDDEMYDFHQHLEWENQSTRGGGIVEQGNQRYLVTIFYREPTHENRACTPLHPYRATYEVMTKNEEMAIDLATKEFRRTEAESMVGWIRVIKRVDVKKLGEHVICKTMGEE